ncbi:hypothetical protein, partial [Roseisolibacter sp. H3M3-2]|uniref:hypothetical protein n=1 Tax=Roseisolibacter sp. H3M3-2 TaxID=3031323 RepID=UPI0023D9AA34
DRRAHHHARGLLLAARGDTKRAIAERRAARAPPPRTYHGCVNLDLADALTRRGRPDEALAALRALLRATTDGFVLPLPRVHAAIARAHDAAGRRDSAAAHRNWVAAAWAGADPDYLARVGWRR